MDTPKFHEMNDDQLRRSFLILGCTFFQLNSNITTTNILRHLSERTGEAGAMIESLRKTVIRRHQAKGRIRVTESVELARDQSGSETTLRSSKCGE